MWQRAACCSLGFAWSVVTMQVPHAGLKRGFPDLSGSYPNGHNEDYCYSDAPYQCAGVVIGWVIYLGNLFNDGVLHCRLSATVCRAALPRQSQQFWILSSCLSALFQPSALFGRATWRRNHVVLPSLVMQPLPVGLFLCSGLCQC